MAETPKRELIKENIMTELAKIKKSAGYLTDVQVVTDDLKLPDEIEAPNFPWLGFTSADEDYPYATNRDIECVTKPIIIGYVRGEGKESIDKELNRLIYDVRRCLLADKRRGENAYMTWINGVITDKGTFGTYAAFEMSLTINYRETLIY